jgi:peptidoglycan/xylan/chitin deacetylase (PgdA/CDA1 family)
VLVVVVLGLAIGLVVVPAWEGSAATHHGAIFGVGTSQKAVALTFDDGPDPRWTPDVLALLAKDKARATFFVVGRRATQHPDLVAMEVRAGDEVGNHTWNHKRLKGLPPAAIGAELEDGEKAIRRAGAPAPRYFRPPYGAADQTMAAVAAAHGYRTVYWGLCVERFSNHHPPGAAVRAILRRVRPGMIILAHDGGPPDRSRTMAVLPAVLRGLARRGYRIDDVTQLMRIDEPHQHPTPAVLAPRPPLASRALGILGAGSAQPMR